MDIEKLRGWQFRYCPAEGGAWPPAEIANVVCQFEIAIQLTRIADALERYVDNEISVDDAVFEHSQPQPAELNVGDTVRVSNPSGEDWGGFEWGYFNKYSGLKFKIIDISEAKIVSVQDENDGEIKIRQLPLVWLVKEA